MVTKTFAATGDSILTIVSKESCGRLARNIFDIFATFDIWLCVAALSPVTIFLWRMFELVTPILQVGRAKPASPTLLYPASPAHQKWQATQEAGLTNLS